MTPRIEKMVFGTYTMYSFGTTKSYSLKVGNEGRTDNMRSIFGRCIAIAMMAAIAIAWHSPPAQAVLTTDEARASLAAAKKSADAAQDSADEAADSVTDAKAAVKDAEAARDAAEDSKDDAEAAETDAKTAQDLILGIADATAADRTAARAAYRDARDAAADAEEEYNTAVSTDVECG